MIPDRKNFAASIVDDLDGRDDGDEQPDDMQGDEPEDDLSALAEDLISAVKSGVADKVADAFRAMFAACESEPHEE